MAERQDPFRDPAPAEVPLARAPLVRVIAQVRFPAIASLARLDYIGPLQEAIRAQFPVLRQDQKVTLALGSQGLALQKDAETVWRFGTRDGNWRLSLAPEFVALETTAYSSRKEFFSHFEFVLRALYDLTKLEVYDRLGVRYINRLTGKDLEDLVTLVRREIVGIAATPFSASLLHSLCESVFSLDDERITARWGVLPENVTPDPTAIEPINERSWILDFDMFTAGAARTFVVDTLVGDGCRFAERIYALFRWSVREAFLARFGGKL